MTAVLYRPHATTGRIVDLLEAWRWDAIWVDTDEIVTLLAEPRDRVTRALHRLAERGVLERRTSKQLPEQGTPQTQWRINERAGLWNT